MVVCSEICRKWKWEAQPEGPNAQQMQHKNELTKHLNRAGLRVGEAMQSVHKATGVIREVRHAGRGGREGPRDAREEQSTTR